MDEFGTGGSSSSRRSSTIDYRENDRRSHNSRDIPVTSVSQGSSPENKMPAKLDFWGSDNESPLMSKLSARNCMLNESFDEIDSENNPNTLQVPGGISRESRFSRFSDTGSGRGSKNGRDSRKRNTIYSLNLHDDAIQVDELPPDILAEYFQKKRATVEINKFQQSQRGRLGSRGNMASGNAEDQGPRILLDEKRIRMLEILLQRLKMTTHICGKEGVAAIKQAFLACDYDLVPLDSLVIVRNVHTAHVEAGEPVKQFVLQNHGNPEKLMTLDHPFCHLLVWEVCVKVPALEERFRMHDVCEQLRPVLSKCV